MQWFIRAQLPAWASYGTMPLSLRLQPQERRYAINGYQTMSTYSVSEVATILDSTAPSVRRWAKDYGDHLSQEASPEPGEARRFNEQDIETLDYIASRLRDGEYRPTILDELAHGVPVRSFGEIVGDGETKQHGESTALATDAQAQAFAAVAQALTGIERTQEGLVGLGELRQRLTALENEVKQLKTVVDSIPGIFKRG